MRFVAVGVGAFGSMLVGHRYLSDWWFATDACPEPTVTCGMMPPSIALVAAGVVSGLLVAMSSPLSSSRAGMLRIDGIVYRPL